MYSARPKFMGLGEEFTEAYEAHFGPFPGYNRGRSLWQSLFDAVHDSAEVSALIAHLSQRKQSGELRGKPFIAECRASMSDLRRRCSPTESEPEVKCSACHGGGYARVVLHREGEIRDRPTWNWTEPGTRQNAAAGLYEFVAHCMCSAGERAAEGYQRAGLRPAAMVVRLRVSQWAAKSWYKRAEGAVPWINRENGDGLASSKVRIPPLHSTTGMPEKPAAGPTPYVPSAPPAVPDPRTPDDCADDEPPARDADGLLPGEAAALAREEGRKALAPPDERDEDPDLIPF